MEWTDTSRFDTYHPALLSHTRRGSVAWGVHRLSLQGVANLRRPLFFSTSFFFFWTKNDHPTAISVNERHSRTPTMAFAANLVKIDIR